MLDSVLVSYMPMYLLQQKKTDLLLGKCSLRTCERWHCGDTLRGWAFNTSVTGPENIRSGSLYSPSLNISNEKPASLKLCPLLTLSLSHQITLPSFLFCLQHGLTQLFGHHRHSERYCYPWAMHATRSAPSQVNNTLYNVETSILSLNWPSSSSESLKYLLRTWNQRVQSQ